MRIAIHSAKGSFSDRWIPYCDKNNIDYKIVNCYASDIMQQLADCDALMWHFNHKGARESKMAKQLLFAVLHAGKVVFPDFNTVWHFDDKVAQKYLLEGIEAPLAPSYVFYSKKEALAWVRSTQFPKVFKLRNGAGSDNVRLVKNQKQAVQLIRKAFGRGFKQYDAWVNLKERLRKYRKGKTSQWNVTKGIIRLGYTTEYARVAGRECGYILFQEFIKGNDSDIRIIVIGDKAFAIKRMVRERDFRASGSGWVLYEKKHFKDEIVKMSFEMADRLGGQSVAFDFVFEGGKTYLLEISYGFLKEVYDECVGYWDKDMRWHPGAFNPYGWMVEDVVRAVKSMGNQDKRQNQLVGDI